MTHECQTKLSRSLALTLAHSLVLNFSPPSRYNDENGDAVGRPYKDSNRDASPEPSEEKKYV